MRRLIRLPALPRARRGAAALAAVALLAACGDDEPTGIGITDQVEVLELVTLATFINQVSGAVPSIVVNAAANSSDGGALAPRLRVIAELTSSGGGGRDTLELRRAVCGGGSQPRYRCDQVYVTLRSGADTAALRARAEDGETFAVIGLSATSALLRTALSAEEGVDIAGGWPEVERASAVGVDNSCLPGLSGDYCAQPDLWLTGTRGPFSVDRRPLRIRTQPGDTITATVRGVFGNTTQATAVLQ